MGGEDQVDHDRRPDDVPAPAPTGPLSGIRVVDLSRILSGPYCTMVLSDLGAEVVKIEQPGTGDDTRAWGPPFLGGEAAYFLSVNRNKRSVAVDLKSPDGLDLVRRLVARADVVVENFRPGTAERLGLGFAALAEVQPRLVYASISGYGHTGPESRRAGYDAIAQARSGVMSVTGEPDGEPVRVGVSSADLAAGMWATIGILAALHERERTGRGQHVDISLLDGQVAWLSYVAGGWFATGKVPPRYGSAHPTIVPYQAFETADGWLMVAVGNDGLWRRFAPAVGLGELVDDERYATNPGRVEHRDTLLPAIAEVLRTRTSAEWVDALDAVGVPVGPINDVGAATRDPQVLARDMVLTAEHPTAGTVSMTGNPVKLSGQVGAPPAAPPLLGQHTDEVLASLGYDDAAVQRLRSAGVVA